MPKSKRNRVVTLTQVQKKTKDHSIAQYTRIREAASQHTHVFVFQVRNMRNSALKDVRQHLPDSRLFFGKTKVMAKALGSTMDEEVLPGISALSDRYLKGNVGLLFTSQDPEQIVEFCEGFAQTTYARAGTAPPYGFKVPAGVVYSRGGEIPVEDDVAVGHSIEPTMRKLGMPTRLVKGKVVLEEDFEVAKPGKKMDSNQTALLKLFGVQMAEFRVRLVARYDAGSQEVVELEGLQDDDEDDEVDEMGME